MMMYISICTKEVENNSSLEPRVMVTVILQSVII
jgi:hypothetical protein